MSHQPFNTEIFSHLMWPWIWSWTLTDCEGNQYAHAARTGHVIPSLRPIAVRYVISLKKIRRLYATKGREVRREGKAKIRCGRVGGNVIATAFREWAWRRALGSS